MAEIINVPSFLASDDTTVSLMSEGGYCGEAGCCTTECSQYCMGSQGGGCGESCSESCGESCSETCTNQTCTNQTTPPSPTLSFSTTGSTTNSISVAVTGMDGSYAGIRRFEWYKDSVLIAETTTSAYATSAYYTYYGLNSSTWYHFDGKIYNETKTILLAHLYTDGVTENAPVEAWYWNSSELNAFNNKGNFSALTASRWNAFCDKINETCIAANESWLNNYTSLYGAKASGSGVPLTALMFNSVRFNIGSRVSTGITEVSTGDTIYGWYFITLQDKLNQWIASL